VQGHQHHLIRGLAVGELVGVGDERHLLEELVHHRELASRADQFAEVLDPPVGFHCVLGLQLGQVSGFLQRTLHDIAGSEIGVGGHRRQPVE
jgi:hypothetical protein